MFPLILFFAFFALQTTSFATSSDSIFTNCAYQTFSCGSLHDVSYPFTGGDRPEYCGQPEFLLKCVNVSVPELTIDSLSYRVLQLDQTGRTISLARSDIYDTGCTTQFNDTTLDQSYFDASSGNEILTLFYGCLPSINSPLNNSFSCELNGGESEDGYFLFGPIPNDQDWSFFPCRGRISLPIFRSSVEKLVFNKSRLWEVLRDGFNASYRNPYEDDCEKCRESHGRCGFDQESVKPICICGDRLCPGGNSGGMSVGLGVGIGGAGIIFILLGCWLFLIIRRRKRKAALFESKVISGPPSSKSLPTPTTNFSQSIPSYPSSKSDLEKGSTYFGVQVFSYTELEKATDNFDASKELGDGGFGIVYYGVLSDGRVVAVKRLYESSVKRVEQFMNEVEILARLRHKNLVTLFGCTSKHSRDLILVYEYIPNGTVADHLLGKQTNSGKLTWPVRLSIALETAEALAFLHAFDVIHRDVKTNNILLDNNFHVKVADFGLSRLFPTNVTHVSTAPQGTPGYVDPEYYQCYHLTDKSDVYSFGVVLIELISSLPAVDTNRHRHDINLANMAINKIQNHALHELVDPCLGFEKDSVIRRMITSVVELAFRCLQQERDMRPSMEEVREILRGIQNENFGGQKAEVVDIGGDDVGLLKNSTPPLSPDSVVTDKWVSSSTTTSSF
ncbi:LEAF RUST 10 DISEASE-RESISTANCE LOCUS RECEPTOR-LIKE PROTEIN KINASE-like 1.4 isoform X3 [Tripterygium wilfordii]|uniref:LEAF RUST 10 DISEASE-RESISTANCE LOCUS RECEPTOR-LIKE PROTEIN KINASE-like 1.4 isoform X3 n=1 Tax=Tripterygium wilfordii TaxID=458696 RepID=UPI0018F84128|nr:LEAF RUST 10 DISEASE-RESISTANCE LOCUS RECEPTOR-LIKE PROTEIN KINASE-like 1.4 isoform X3 [Tripterygium wilfordii]